MSTNQMAVKFDFTRSFSTAENPVGTIYEADGKSYVFALNAGADSTAVGDVVSIYDSTGTTYGSVSVTAATILDCSDGTTTRALVAGVAGCIAATATYLWLWFDGYGTHAVTTDGNVVKGGGLVVENGEKVAKPNGTAGTAHWLQFGMALADDATTTLSKTMLGGPGMFRWARGH